MPFRLCLYCFVHCSAVASLCVSGLAKAENTSISSQATTQTEATAQNRSQIILLGPSAVSPPATLANPAPANRPVPSGQTDLLPIDLSAELRIARRPWLLQKLTDNRPEPSQKMNPPRPPAELPDPPSMSGIVPESRAIESQRRRLSDPVQSPAPSGLSAESAGGLQGDPQHRYSDTAARGETASPSQAVVEQPTHPLVESAAEQAVSDNIEELTVGDIEDELVDEIADVIVGKIEPPQLELRQPLEVQRVDKTPPILGLQAAEKESSHDGTAVGDLSIELNDEITQQDPIAAVETGEHPPDQRSKPDQQSSQIDQSEPSQYVGDLETVNQKQSAASPPTAQPLDYTGRPGGSIRLTRNVMRMRAMMQQCLRYYYNRPEQADERSNWGMMHAIMVYGIDTKIIVGNQRYSAIAWIAGNNACRGQKLLSESNGQITANSGVGLQGHQGQFLAVLSLAGVPRDYVLYADSKKHTVDDLVKSEMLACKSAEELTFTLIGLSHYLNTDTKWRAADGELWDFQRLLREELAQPIVGAACGGTHRLMGFGHALRARRAEGKPITGQWQRAEKYLQDFVAYTYRLQNRDGSMSTDWLEGRQDTDDLDRRIQTTGHIVEWLLTVTPDSELQNPRLVNAIGFLLKSMYHERNHDWEIGPKGHALRSLAMYYERVYQSGPAWRHITTARSRSTRQR